MSAPAGAARTWQPGRDRLVHCPSFDLGHPDLAHQQRLEGTSLGDPAPYAVAITGGSGKYQGVEGEIRVLPASETQPRGILTFHLQD